MTPQVYIFHEAHKDLLNQPIRDRRTFAVVVTHACYQGVEIVKLHLRIGIGRCSPLDHFSRQVGRGIALSRALLSRDGDGPNGFLKVGEVRGADLRDGKARFMAILRYLEVEFKFRAR